ncbi:hypothetical protein AVEN_155371-1 [Araneus ventricosus]|uniref:Uncharacterized protein n=1 Tax=Araneus ventricosus TaxID=182803 RepID=A0A4Y2MYN5_ARAVE|nr:hypothetical protein AVEN_155371-1 [Araneus ventricosus]
MMVARNARISYEISTFLELSVIDFTPAARAFFVIVACPDVFGEKGIFLRIRTVPAVIVVFEEESEFPLSLIEELGCYRILRSFYSNGLRNKRASKKKWEYPFSYLETPDPLHCSSVALLLPSPSASSTNSFTLKGWLSEYVVKVPQNAVIIYVEITGSPERKFYVMAQISGPGLKSPVSIELRDNGNGG